MEGSGTIIDILLDILLDDILLDILGGGGPILPILEPSPGLVSSGLSNNKSEILGLILPDFLSEVIFFYRSSAIFLDCFGINGSSSSESGLDFIIWVSEG